MATRVDAALEPQAERAGLIANQAVLVPALLGATTFAIYMIGAGRTLGYDAAVTFAHFIATPSIWDPFGRTSYDGIPASAHVGNNHLLFSFLEHLIYSATGTRSEAIYRLLPTAAAGAAVGLTAYAVSRRFGTLSGAAAGVFMATNPLFVEQSRDLRGYSLMTLFAVLSTMALARLLDSERSPSVPPRPGGTTGGSRVQHQAPWLAPAYVAAAAAAIVTQPYAALVLVGHLVLIAATADRAKVVRLGSLVVAAGLLGVLPYAGLVQVYRVGAAEQGRLFNPAFGLLLGLFLLGAPYPIAVGLWLATAGLGLWALRRDRAVLWLTAVAAVMIGFIWLALQPTLLYPRFFVFLVPGCAFLIGAAVKRWVVLAPVVLAGAIVAVAGQAPTFTEDQLALRSAAQVLDSTAARGERGCVIHKDEEVVRAYTTNFTVVRSPEELAACDVIVVVTWNVNLTIRDQAAQDFPHAQRYPAWYPTVVLSREPR